jgi:ribonuclease P protein component
VNPAAPLLTFPKEARLLARREFLLLQQRGKKRQGQHFLVITAPGRTQRSRLGITTSRRFGKSVDRNRMKRLLREFFREHQHALFPAVDIVIIPKAGAQELSLLQIDAELERLLSLPRLAS